MQNYDNWKNKNSRSAILDALNNGVSSKTHTFGSVTDFISGILGKDINSQIEDNKLPSDDVEAIRFNNTASQENYNSSHTDDTFNDDNYDEDEEEFEDNIEDTGDNTSGHYKVYRDKEENFECNISVQGAKISNSQARLVLDHEICNLVFYGKLNKDGKCIVSLKKMTHFPEGTTGRIRLEVIVDDTIFIPWEETFIVEGAKKVTVQIKPQKKVDLRF